MGCTSSPLTQGRELKQRSGSGGIFAAVSPLTQGRELKQDTGMGIEQDAESPLTQGRELKLFTLKSKHQNQKVAPHAGA